tara:strand:+ start:9182 stop:9502 length:321 start_codon:yes stop_codon:yes gene_type:complete
MTDQTATASHVSPTVGEGATVIHFSDRTGATVIAVSPSGKTITVQEDTATRTDDHGMSDMQHYTFERYEEGRTWKATLRKDGRYRVCNSTQLVGVGNRSTYYDYSF